MESDYSMKHCSHKFGGVRYTIVDLRPAMSVFGVKLEACCVTDRTCRNFLRVQVKELLAERVAANDANGYGHSCGLQAAREAVAKKFSPNPKHPLKFEGDYFWTR